VSDVDDVRWLAQKVVAKAFHAVSDASVEALAKRVLELEAVVDACRSVGVDVTRREDGAGWAVSNTRAPDTEEHAAIGRGDPVKWEPVPSDVVVAVCVEYREKVVTALKEWMENTPYTARARRSWVDVIESVRMLK
jgi:hypothetical protein